MEQFFKSCYDWLFSLNNSNIIALSSTIVSIIAIFFSHLSSKKANNLTVLVNSVEFELYKKLKFEYLNLIAKFRALEAKAAVSPHLTEEADYARELDSIKELQASPVFLLMLYSIKDEDKRNLFEIRLRLFTTSKFSSFDLRKWGQLIRESIEDNMDFKKIVKMDYETFAKELCKMKSIFDLDSNDELKDTKETGQEVISKDEVGNLKESQGRIDLEKFTYYLIDECKVKDPDVLMFYGVFKDDKLIVRQALNEGANVKVSDKQIINKYQVEYERFNKRNQRS